MSTPARLQPVPRSSLPELSLREAARLIREGEVTSLAYAVQLLEICQRNAHLNAFISLDAGRVLDRAREADLHRARNRPLGRLHGVPIALKDNINTVDLPTSGGTAALRYNRPQRDATVVRHLRREGAIVLGKTGLHELSMGWTGDNPTFGRVLNPHALDRIAGGSSSGSAAAVTAFMTPAALGTDTNGSIRIPASLCGIVGYRPSLGRYSLEGVMPLAGTLDTVGLLARDAADVQLLDAVLRGASEEPSAMVQPSGDLRIGIAPAYYLGGLDREVERLFSAAVQNLEKQGVKFVTADMPELDALAAGTAAAIIRGDAPQMLQGYLTAHAPLTTLAKVTDERGQELGLSLQRPHAADYHDALQRQERLREVFIDHFAIHGLTAMMHPVVLMPAPPFGSDRISPAPGVAVNGQLLPARTAYGRNVAPLSLAGGAGLVLPAGVTTAGLPVGVSFEVPPGQDDDLLRIGPMLGRLLGPAPRPALNLFRPSAAPIGGRPSF